MSNIETRTNNANLNSNNINNLNKEGKMSNIETRTNNVNLNNNTNNVNFEETTKKEGVMRNQNNVLSIKVMNQSVIDGAENFMGDFHEFLSKEIFTDRNLYDEELLEFFKFNDHSKKNKYGNLYTMDIISPRYFTSPDDNKSLGDYTVNGTGLQRVMLVYTNSNSLENTTIRIAHDELLFNEFINSNKEIADLLREIGIDKIKSQLIGRFDISNFFRGIKEETLRNILNEYKSDSIELIKKYFYEEETDEIMNLEATNYTDSLTVITLLYLEKNRSMPDDVERAIKRYLEVFFLKEYRQILRDIIPDSSRFVELASQYVEVEAKCNFIIKGLPYETEFMKALIESGIFTMDWNKSFYEAFNGIYFGHPFFRIKKKDDGTIDYVIFDIYITITNHEAFLKVLRKNLNYMQKKVKEFAVQYEDDINVKKYKGLNRDINKFKRLIKKYYDEVFNPLESHDKKNEKK